MPLNTDIAARTRIFREVTPYFATVQPASFFQDTRRTIPGVVRLHNLASGIFKPKDSVYALCITSMLSSPYHDEVHYNSDRTWWMHYSPKSGGLAHAANASLIRCMSDRQPVLIAKQVSDKSSRSGSTYRLLGLGFVEHFDAANDLFRIRGLEWAEVSTVLGLGLSDDLVETALRLESLEAWTPFVAEDRAVYQVSRERRDTAFAGIVLDNYAHTCAVSGQRFQSSRHTEADGAHIIGRAVRGTDDPRNGIALSKSIHWAFDRGIFTISDQYEVIINPQARSANIANFPLLSLDRSKIALPKDNYYWPHPEALAWHKSEIFDKFSL